MEQEKKKRKATPAQLENLRKGFQALQAKRKALAEKDSEPPAPAPAPAPAPEPVPIPAPAPPPDALKSGDLATTPKERKKREKKPAFNPDEFRSSLLADLRSGQTERIIEKPVDRIVEKEKVVFKDRVVSGSELLNRIFGFD